MLGKYKESILALEAGIIYYPNKPRILCNLGISYLMEGEAKSAIDTFIYSVELEPDFEKTHKLLKIF